MQARKILILGASSSLAQATARLYAKEGAEFFLVARDEKKLEAVAADLKTRGAKSVSSLTSNLANCAGHRAVLQKAEAALGTWDVVLVAYGILGDALLASNDFGEAERILHTNFVSVVSLLTALGPRLAANRSGTLAVISSVAGDRGRASNYVYGSSKGGLSTYLSGLRARLTPEGVNVLTIKPGFVDTEMTRAFSKGPLWASKESVAKGIYRAVNHRKDVVYLPWFWYWIMAVVNHIPERLFKRLKI